jgi:predicted nucleotidyltransferase
MTSETPSFGVVSVGRIRDLARRIAREFHPEKIILFGSYAYGRPTPDSDVDLMVIMPFQGRPVDRSVEIRLKVRPSFPIDLIVRTPEKVRQRVEMGDCFMREILEKGKALYEAPRQGPKDI